METMGLNLPVRKSDADRSARQQVVSSRRSHMTLHMTARRDAVHLPYLSPLLRFAYRGFDVSVIWNSRRSCVSTYARFSKWIDHAESSIEIRTTYIYVCARVRAFAYIFIYALDIFLIFISYTYVYALIVCIYFFSLVGEITKLI